MKKKSRRRVICILFVFWMVAWSGDTLQAMAADQQLKESEGPFSELPSDLQEGETERVYLDVDSKYAYEGMERSFAEGYQPEVKNGFLYLVIPFTANGALAGERLNVFLDFPETDPSPFLFQNYQKTVEKGRYILKNGKMVCLWNYEKTAATEEAETYLYSLKIPLSRKATPGQYAMTVRAFGYTKQMEQVSLERRIFVLIPDTEHLGGSGMGNVNGDIQDGNGGNGTGEPDGDHQDGNGGDGTGEPNGDIQDENGGNNGEGGVGDKTGNGDGELKEAEKMGEEKREYGGSFGGGAGEGNGDTEELIRQPKILLETDSLSERELVTGEEEKLSVRLRNCSGSQPLYNLKVAVSTEDSGVRISPNSFYVASADPGEAVVLETDLKITPDTAGGEIALVFEFEYEDKKGNALTGKEMIFLSVKQPVEVQFQTDELPDILYASDTLELSLQACNTGRAQIRNVRASLYAEGLFPDGEVFIGNLEAGTAGEGTMQVYIGTRNMESAGKRTNEGNGEIYGPVEGRIIFQYEDVDGRVYEEVKSFQTEIKKAQVVSFAVEEPEETNSWWVSVTAVAFTGLLLWILLLFLRLRKKNILLAEAISSRIPEGGERKR